MNDLERTAVEHLPNIMPAGSGMMLPLQCEDLTPAERRVAALQQLGLSAREIADVLHLSLTSVQAMIVRIRRERGGDGAADTACA